MRMFLEIPDFLIPWIKTQQMFWVASAPLAASGHVNISPKGIQGTFHIENSHQVWYEDLSGSGVETISHIRENRRITLLFNAFEGLPRTARLFGKGTVYEFGTLEYNKYLPEGIRHPGSRAIIFVDVIKVTTTCGWSVPLYEFKAQRTQLLKWGEKKEAADRKAEPFMLTSTRQQAVVASPLSPAPAAAAPLGMKRWWEENNITSLDGLPGIISAHAIPNKSSSSSHSIFNSRPIGPTSRYEVASASTWTTPPSGQRVFAPFAWLIMDWKLVIAFLFGVFVTVLGKPLYPVDN